MMAGTASHPGAWRVETVAAAVIVVAAVYLARDLLIPLVLAVFFAFLLDPLVRRIERLGLGHTPAVITVGLLTFSLIGVLGWFVSSQAVRLAGQLPEYQQNIAEKVAAVRDAVTERLHPVSRILETVADESETTPDEQVGPLTPAETDAQAGPVAAPEQRADAEDDGDTLLGTSPARLLGTALPFVLHPLAAIGLVGVFTSFFLVFREDLRDRLIRVCGDARIGLTTAAVTDAGTRLSRYFAGLVLVNGLNGAAIAFGLTLIGMPNALLLGVLAGLLRFVPFLGPWVAAGLAMVLSLAIFDGWTTPLLVAALYFVVDMLSLNVMEPLMYSARTGASATAVLIAIVAWTWLSGTVGLVLATPITVCLVVLGKHVPRLRILHVLFGDEPVLSPHVRLYQRVLAADEKEARTIVAGADHTHAPEEVISHLIVPTLALMVADRRSEILDEARLADAARLVERLMDGILPAPRVGAGHDGDIGASAGPMLVPMHGICDTLCVRMLARVLATRGGVAGVTAPFVTSGELLELISSEERSCVCIVTLDSDHARRVELLCRRLVRARPAITVMVAVWDPALDRSWLVRRMDRFAQVRVCDSFEVAVRELETYARMRRVDDRTRATRAGGPPSWDATLRPSAQARTWDAATVPQPEWFG